MRAGLRRRLLTIFAVAAVPIVVASAAYACQSTVTLYSSSKTVAQGATITVTGNKYNSSTAFGPVQIRLDKQTGTVLASATPVAGNISTSVTIPAGTPTGFHILIATQYNNTTGAPCTGCPGRTSIKVVTPPASTGASSLGGTSLLANPFGLVGIGLASLAFAVVRRRRRASTVA